MKLSLYIFILVIAWNPLNALADDAWTKFRVTFWTMNDNKDKEENIAASIYRYESDPAGQVNKVYIGEASGWGNNQEWDEGDYRSFDITTSQSVSRKYAQAHGIRIEKTCYDTKNGRGWDMDFEVSALNSNGTYTVMIPRTGTYRLGDDQPPVMNVNFR